MTNQGCFGQMVFPKDPMWAIFVSFCHILAIHVTLA